MQEAIGDKQKFFWKLWATPFPKSTGSIFLALSDPALSNWSAVISSRRWRGHCDPDCFLQLRLEVLKQTRLVAKINISWSNPWYLPSCWPHGSVCLSAPVRPVPYKTILDEMIHSEPAATSRCGPACSPCLSANLEKYWKDSRATGCCEIREWPFWQRVQAGWGKASIPSEWQQVPEPHLGEFPKDTGLMWLHRLSDSLLPQQRWNLLTT